MEQLELEEYLEILKKKRDLRPLGVVAYPESSGTYFVVGSGVTMTLPESNPGASMTISVSADESGLEFEPMPFFGYNQTVDFGSITASGAFNYPDGIPLIDGNI